jgi:hypothetical protein
MTGTDREECKPCEHTLNVHGPSGCHKRVTGFEGAYRCPCTYSTLTFGFQPSRPKPKPALRFPCTVCDADPGEERDSVYGDGFTHAIRV